MGKLWAYIILNLHRWLLHQSQSDFRWTVRCKNEHTSPCVFRFMNRALQPGMTQFLTLCRCSTEPKRSNQRTTRCAIITSIVELLVAMLHFFQNRLASYRFRRWAYDVSKLGGGYAVEELGQFHSETGWAERAVAGRGISPRSIANLSVVN